MHCKYCGYALPSKGIVCQNCGKTISNEQLQFQKNNQLDNWDYISNQNTAKYKSHQASEPNKVKARFLIIGIIAILILIALLKTL